RALLSETQTHMAAVHAIFAELIGADDDEESNTEQYYHELWDMAHKSEVMSHILEQDVHSDEPDVMARVIVHFKDDLAKKTLGPRGREVLNR
ncbi:hypothetical protein JI666_21050, partial [Bacillus sp. NTK071]